MRRFRSGTIPLLVLWMIGLAVVPLGCSKHEEEEGAEAAHVDPVPVRVSVCPRSLLVQTDRPLVPRYKRGMANSFFYER